MEDYSCNVTGEPLCKCKYIIEGYEPPTVKEALRKLFSDHAVYTNNYIMAEIFQNPNLSQITERLLENQVDIGEYLKKFIGKRKSDTLIKLLKEHIVFASNFVTQSIISNSRKIKNAEENLFDNSTKIAEFLNSLNSDKLPFEDVKIHFDEHVQYVINLTKLYIKEKYQQAITEYDCYYVHMIRFSDMLARAFE